MRAAGTGAACALVAILAGPALPSSDESPAGWLARWSGHGNLRLFDGVLSPVPAWESILAFADLRVPIDLEELKSEFHVREGAVETEHLRLNRRTTSWSLRGRATLGGAIDYEIDLRGLLRGHEDGDRILKYLGDTAVSAKLTGTVDAPEIAGPNYRDLLQKALPGAVRGALESDLQRRLRGLLKKKRK